MNIVQINLTYQIGSTGHIVSDLDMVLEKKGHHSFIVCGYSSVRKKENIYTMQTLPAMWDIRKDILLGRITGRMGYNSKWSTIKAIQWIKEKRPDIVHLHNIHGNYINIDLLFRYLRNNGVSVIWTLHDCWAFTGRCSHFEFVGCNKWKKGCGGCPSLDVYPISYFFDFSQKMWRDKKKNFTSLNKVQIVTPSKWLKAYVNESFLKQYPISVIPNGIDLDIFHPYQTESSGKNIILGVASSWSERKGLYDIYKLDEMIDRSQNQITLVGLNDRQLKKLPKTIHGIKRTNDIHELAELYSRAKVFINPTYQDNYPTVNLEAIACGVPVVTYRTGGSPESVNESVGIVVEKGNVEAMAKAVADIIGKPLFSKKICVDYAKRNFSKEDRYKEYIKIYETMQEGSMC